MDKEKEILDIIAQKRLIKTIIGKGTKFTITYTVKVRQKGLLGFMKPKVDEERTEEFTMKEPTLAVLDRASEVWLRMNTDNIDKEGADVKTEGFRMAKEHAHDMAEVIAILVLGEKYYLRNEHKGATWKLLFWPWKKFWKWWVSENIGTNDKELERLTDLFYKTIKPSQVNELALLINATSNVVDFVDSTRLMKMSITTTPTKRVE